MTEKKLSGKKIFLIAISLILILLLRNYVFVLLIPPLLGWFLSVRKPGSTLLIFTLIYAICAFFFFISGFISPKIDLPKYTVDRQEQFVELADSSHSSIEVQPLQTSLKSFLKFTPQAIDHAFLRPYLSGIATKFFLPFAIEILIYKVLFLLFIFFRKKEIRRSPIIYFCVFFSVSMLICIGFIVTNVGSLVRYRSLYLIFLMLPIICNIDWAKIKYIKFKKI
jgi:hypothetical protein